MYFFVFVDLSFVEKMYKNLKSSSHLIVPNDAKSLKFSVAHFAGDIQYSTVGMYNCIWMYNKCHINISFTHLKRGIIFEI